MTRWVELRPSKNAVHATLASEVAAKGKKPHAQEKE
jgi:hypothetical protein